MPHRIVYLNFHDSQSRNTQGPDRVSISYSNENFVVTFGVPCITDTVVCLL